MKRGKFGFSDRKHLELSLGGEKRRLDGGINAGDMPYALEGGQARDMLNLWYRDGSLRKRWGQENFAQIEGEEIDKAFCDGKGNVFMQAGSRLYFMMLDDPEPTVMNTLTVPAGKTRAPVGSFIRSGDDVLYLNGVDYLIHYSDSSVFTDVEPYVPTVLTDCNPETRESVSCEPYNLLGRVFRIVYNGMYKTKYYIPFECDVGPSPMYAVVNGVTMRENRGFTVDRSEYSVTFSQAPFAGYNNIELYITLPYDDDVKAVKSCTCGVIYGGDSRLILGGNGTNTVYCSEAFDPSYFPQNMTLPVGNGEAIVGFGQQYDFLAAFKRNEIAYIKYSYTSEKTVLSASVLNPHIGCDMPGTICNVGNRIVFANTENGVCIIAATSRENERNILYISRNIDPLLFAEPYADMLRAQAAVFDGRYWLSVGDHVFLWDHSAKVLNAVGGEEKMRALSWYRFDNIPAAAFFSHGRELYYCRRGGAGNGGGIVHFTKGFTDFGEPVKAVWKSGMLGFGKPNHYKCIEKLWFVFGGQDRCEAKLRYVFCDRQYMQTKTDAQPISARDLSPGRTPGALQTVMRSIRQKNTVFFSLEIESNEACDLALSDVVIGYSVEYAVK